VEKVVRRIFIRSHKAWGYRVWTRRVAGASLVVGLSGIFATAAAAQIASDQTSNDQVGQVPNEPPAPAPQAPSAEITVTAKRLTQPRATVAADIGASSYALTNQSIENLPGGDNASLSNVLLQAPGVAQDNMANGAIHIRNEHLAAQYRVNGVMLPDGVSFFGEGISPRFIQSMNLITGTLPAQYGLRTSGVVDITTKSGVFQDGGSIGIYGGSYWTMQPSVDYGGNADGYNYFVSGDFMHNDHGINSPVPNYDAVHDETNQEHGFGYIEKQIDPSSKLSAIVGSFVGRFQVPNNPGQPIANTVNGNSAFDSNALNENQNESANFGVLSYLHTEENWDIQISPYTKYSTLKYSPDIYGDLAFGGVSQYALRQDFTNGIQADGSYKLAETHTLRAGMLASAERSSADTTSLVECTAAPCPSGGTVGDTPLAVVDNSAKTGWSYSAYLQDEWKIFPSLTLNYGGRFDAVNTSTMESQFSPRVNAVWNATNSTTVHIGYANYFTPPPFDIVTLGSVSSLANTTGASPSTGNSPVKAERSQYFDAGVTQDIPQLPGLKVGLDAYYKYARNLLDEGQFGAPIILTPFNYHVGYTKGVELTTTYDSGAFSYYGNLAIGTEKAEGISSAQFNFTQSDLDYINSHLINTDHSQTMTASAGMSYVLDGTTYSVDLIAGTGVRTQEVNNTIPNGSTVPSYEQVNFGVSHKFEDAPGGPIDIRADLINAFDETYLIREQSGIGVNSPQYGPRRTFFVGVRKYF
jgi:outer membrane receptor protein involved in Fe transport